MQVAETYKNPSKRARRCNPATKVDLAVASCRRRIEHNTQSIVWFKVCTMYSRHAMAQNCSVMRGVHSVTHVYRQLTGQSWEAVGGLRHGGVIIMTVCYATVVCAALACIPAEHAAVSRQHLRTASPEQQ